MNRKAAVKRILCLALCALLLPLHAFAAEGGALEPWSRTEPGGGYVTVRVPCPEGAELPWSQQRYLCVRYADSKEVVPLVSGYFRDGCLFATVPADRAGRPLETFVGEVFHFYDAITVWKGEEYYEAPQGTGELYVRGIVQGDGAGNLNAEAAITRAEAFALVVRLLSLEAAGDPGYTDVAPGDWFYDTASAARAAGIAAEDTHFHPERPVTRGEIAVMLCRAMQAVGWVEETAGTAQDLDYVDAQTIPAWALSAYLSLNAYHAAPPATRRETGEMAEDGPVYETLAESGKEATRGEVIETIYSALRYVPWYPTQAAVAWGFDREMPVIDGSTSTYPYTASVFGYLFGGYSNQPQFPAAHSKSYYSYERLISGEADILFASTKPTQDTLAKAAAAGVELELIPIAHDAMVFFTNGENPAENLTMEQIRAIYVDNAYENWSELGGPDAVLIPYCRNMDSGSQAQMEEFFLKGSEIHPEIRRETTSVSMASVLTDVWEAQTADPLAYALGYSIYYYYQAASTILLPSGDTLKLLSVEGVFPTDETIADGSYPLAGYNYAVVRADAPEDSPARRMVEFMLSPEGQACVRNAGFGPLDAG